MDTDDLRIPVKRRRRRCRLIESDSDNEPTITRPPNTSEALPGDQANQVMKSSSKEQHSSIPSVPAECSGFSTSSPARADSPGHIIKFVYEEWAQSPWDSLGEDSVLDTSTPDFKPGKHGEDTSRTVSPEQEDKENEALHALILKEGIHYQLPSWMRRTKDSSVHILADHHLDQWPLEDRHCQIIFLQHLPPVTVNREN